jgi:hypothetical protein
VTKHHADNERIKRRYFRLPKGSGRIQRAECGRRRKGIEPFRGAHLAQGLIISKGRVHHVESTSEVSVAAALSSTDRGSCQFLSGPGERLGAGQKAASGGRASLQGHPGSRRP